MEEKSCSPPDAPAVLRALAAMRQELALRFSVRRIGVFGSCARDEAGPASDVDIIVELAEPTLATIPSQPDPSLTHRSYPG